MTYKIEQFVNKITSPITVLLGNERLEYSSGAELADTNFEKPYIVQSVSAKEDKVVIVLAENDRINEAYWGSEKQADFF